MAKAERRAQILDATASLLAGRGFHGLSIQDVADACGLSQTGVLHHFPTKETLLLELLKDRDARDYEELVEYGSLTAASPADALLALVTRNAQRREFVRLYAVLEAESLADDHPAHDYFADRQARALHEFSRIAPAGVDSTAFARSVLAMMDGLQLQWLREPGLDLPDAWLGAAASIPGLAASAGCGEPTG